MDKLKSELEKCTTKNTPRFSFDCQEFLCKCVKVYDGDTITVVFKPFPSSDNIYKYNVRLLGIDTPEIKSKNLDEKQKAIEIRDLLQKKILNKFVMIQCGSFDKYGRLLANVYDEDTLHINKWLVDEGYANTYYGGTKQEFK
jgi:micrococcal nuclease